MENRAHNVYNITNCSVSLKIIPVLNNNTKTDYIKQTDGIVWKVIHDYSSLAVNMT